MNISRSYTRDHVNHRYVMYLIFKNYYSYDLILLPALLSCVGCIAMYSSIFACSFMSRLARAVSGDRARRAEEPNQLAFVADYGDDASNEVAADNSSAGGAPSPTLSPAVNYDAVRAIEQSVIWALIGDRHEELNAFEAYIRKRRAQYTEEDKTIKSDGAAVKAKLEGLRSAPNKDKKDFLKLMQRPIYAAYVRHHLANPPAH